MHFEGQSGYCRKGLIGKPLVKRIAPGGIPTEIDLRSSTIEAINEVPRFVASQVIRT